MARQAVSAVDNGKALEYCFAITYFNHLNGLGINVQINTDAAYNNVLASYNRVNAANAMSAAQFMAAAQSTIPAMLQIEPGLLDEKNNTDVLVISIAPDAAGQLGDVRDILFTRGNWKIGFSVKNNHDAAKHSRLSPHIDFGQSWLGYPCSIGYFNDINIIFNQIKGLSALNPNTLWATAFPNKYQAVYVPLLDAFRRELLRLNGLHNDVPRKLLSYLIGRHSFYKMIKSDRYNLMVVKGYNVNRDLAKRYNVTPPVCGVPVTTPPTRIIEFIQLPTDLTSLYMTLDNGWQIKFRIHSASSRLESSLKFDITLIGNPPVLFTHHIF